MLYSKSSLGLSINDITATGRKGVNCFVTKAQHSKYLRLFKNAKKIPKFRDVIILLTSPIDYFYGEEGYGVYILAISPPPRRGGKHFLEFGEENSPLKKKKFQN
jgi:hypothetical protein